MRGVTVTVISLLSVAMTGCATAPSYQKQVSDLSDAFSKMKSSFDALAEDERQTFVSLRTKKGLREGYLILIPDKCYQEANGRGRPTTSPFDCRPQIVSKATREVVRTIEFSSVVPNATRLAGIIVDYAAGLVSITQSKDIADLKDAVGKAGAAISKLQSDVTGASTSASFGAITGFATFAIGKLLDAERFELLKGVVESADPLVADAANLLSRDALKFQKSLVAQKSELLSLDNTQLEHLRNENADQATIAKAADSLVASAVALEQFARTDVISPFKKMREAHGALLGGLRNPQIPPEVAFRQISEFVDQIDKLRKGLEPTK